MDLESFKQTFKKLDWRTLKAMASPRAADDLNTFLEKIPQNTNQAMLVIAAIVWASAGGVGLYTTVQLQKLTELRTELEEAEALKPNVPIIQDVAVNAAAVDSFIEKTKEIYRGLDIKVSGTTVRITAPTTGSFGQFREAISHIQNGGLGWRVSIDQLCVGRECDKFPLTADLKINKVSVTQQK